MTLFDAATFLAHKHMNTPRHACVYTAMIGDYEELNEQPVAAASATPFICLTDNPNLKSNSWQIVQVTATFAMDPIRSQRLLKICPHRIDALAEFQCSLYIDNSVLLREPPEKIFERVEWGSGFGLPGHSYRKSIHDEFIEVARIGLDDPGRIFEQLNHYLACGDPSLNEVPFWAAILLRDHHNTKVQRAMDLWLAHVLRYCRRDQLSLHTALRQTDLIADRWELDNYASWFHSWPHTPGRTRFAGVRLPMNSLMPVPTQLQQARNELQQGRHDVQLAGQALDKARAETEAERQVVETLQEALNTAHCAIRDMSKCLATSDRERTDATQKYTEAEMALVSTLAAIRSSTSWRLTAPLRQLKTWLN